MSAVVDFPVKPEARPYLDAFGRDDRRACSEPDWLAGIAGGARPLCRARLPEPSQRGVALSRSARARREPDASSGRVAGCRRRGDPRPTRRGRVFRGGLSSRPRRRAVCAGALRESEDCLRASGSVRWRRRSPSGPIWYGPRSKRRCSTPLGRLPRSMPRSSPTASSSISRRGLPSIDRSRSFTWRRATPAARCTRAASWPSGPAAAPRFSRPSPAAAVTGATM